MPSDDSAGGYRIEEYTADVIVATQSCDLEQAKVSQVEVIPVYSLADWLREQPFFYNQLDSIRRGHVPGAYLLPAWPEAPIETACRTRIVAIDEKHGISWRDLEGACRGPRLGLRSPYIEHFGQAVARFYLRVGLPEDMPPVEWKAADDGRRERVILSPGDFAAGPAAPAAPLPVSIYRLMMAAGPDVLYRAALDRDASFFGVGGTPEDAVVSLKQLLLARRDELARRIVSEGQRRHWLLDLFP
ncbi:MAG TPA: hypothetical protein VNL16_16640 [Chloroflexota bacterium]|nr:hypothetical protein [Chloroflexota bacterium]